MKTLLITTAAVFAALATARAEEEKPMLTPAPEPAAEAGALGDSEIDEIDLEEDDSAAAAKKPSIKGSNGSADYSLVDIECDEATITDILRQFRKTTGANIIHGDTTNLQRRVSVSLKHVPWMQGLTAILNSRGFRLEQRENIFRVIEDLQTIPVSTRTFVLNHASAKDLAALFNATYAKKDANGKINNPIASSFDEANVVVVTSTDKVLSECEAIIKSVDRAVAQIYIEARFIELTGTTSHKLGLDWSMLDSFGATLNVNAGMEYNNGRVNNFGLKASEATTTSSTSTSDSSSVASGSTTTSSSNSGTTSGTTTLTGLVPEEILEATGSGRSAASMGWRNARGFSGQLTMSEMKLALSAFEQMEEAKMFSNPKIIVSNGKQALVDMTTKEPNVTVEANYTGTSSQNMNISTKLETIPGEDKLMFAGEAFFSYGISLSVTPRISPDGLINVEIVPTISEKVGEKEISGASDNAVYTTYPEINVKRLTTNFTMKDGATAVIGGLTQTKEDDVDSGIPYLRKIPWIGPKLFGWKSRQKVQSEILVFVTIGIADPANLPKDIGLPKNAIIGREYVNGTRLEPGDRKGTAAEVLALDLTPIEEREKKERKAAKSQPEAEPEKGKVEIKFVEE